MYRKFITISTIKTVQAEWTFWRQQGNVSCKNLLQVKMTGIEGGGGLQYFCSDVVFLRCLQYLPMDTTNSNSL